MSQMRKLAVLFSFVLLNFISAAQPLYADGTSLGGKFECSGTAVFQNGAKVNLAKVNKHLGKSISKLKAQLAQARAQGAPKQKLKLLAEQIKRSKATRAALKACARGVAVDPIWERLAGQYPSGVCQDKLLGLSSNMRAGFALLGPNFSAEINIDGFLGQLFGGGKLKISANVAGVNFPATLRTTGTVAGDIDFILDQNGRLQVILTNVPVAHVERAELNAELVNNDGAIVGNFSIAQSGGAIFSKGSFYLSR